MSVNLAFATRLKALREEKNLNQGQLAKALGMSRGSISFYENGERTPDIETLDKVSKFFDVSYNYLLGKSTMKRSTIEETAISEYTGLNDFNICLLHNNERHYQNDILNIFITLLLEENELLSNIEDYIFYNSLYCYAEFLFYEFYVNEYSIPIENEDELSSYNKSFIIQNYLIDKPGNIVNIFKADEKRFYRKIQYIADKRDLLEYKVSKIIGAAVSNIYEDSQYNDYMLKMYDFIEQYTLSDLTNENSISSFYDYNRLKFDENVREWLEDEKKV